jgi:hypothetical protein
MIDAGMYPCSPLRFICDSIFDYFVGGRVVLLDLFYLIWRAVV